MWAILDENPMAGPEDITVQYPLDIRMLFTVDRSCPSAIQHVMTPGRDRLLEYVSSCASQLLLQGWAPDPAQCQPNRVFEAAPPTAPKLPFARKGANII